MKKWLLAACILLLFCVSALAEEADGAHFSYGKWSEWSKTQPEQAPDTEVESRLFSGETQKHLYHYKRYVYFDSDCEQWFSTWKDETGAHEEDGTGGWEETDSEEQKEILYIDDAYIVYDGGWYFETESTESVWEEYTLYRSRTVKRLKAELSRHEAVLNIGEKLELNVTQYEEIGEVTFVSSDESVASVTEEGTIKAKKKGLANISAMCGDEELDTCSIEVVRKASALSNGLYSIVLSQDGFLLGIEGSKPYEGAAAVLSMGAWRNMSRFRLENTGDNTFLLRCGSDTTMALALASDGTLALAVVPVEEDADIPSNMLWRTMESADGSYRIYPLGSPNSAIGVSEALLDVNVQVFDAEIGNSLRSWTLKKKIESVLDEECVLPVPTDGSCYVTSEFGVQRTETHVHQGIDIGSFGKRVDCYAVASGKVIRIRTECEHDYGKTHMANGRYVDPCGNTAGNYVYIDHGDGFVTMYMHLSRVDVKVGDTVTAGQLIGRTGSTGSSSGVHLHFAVKYNDEYVDPRDYFDFPPIGYGIK